MADMVYPVQVVGAALVDSLQNPTRILLGQRSAPPALAGLWEFPGGKVEPQESCQEALKRELVEELGVEIILGREMNGPHPQGWPLNEKASMRVWLAEITDGQPATLQDHLALEWFPLDAELIKVAWIPANLPITRALLSLSV